MRGTFGLMVILPLESCSAIMFWNCFYQKVFLAKMLNKIGTISNAMVKYIIGNTENCSKIAPPKALPITIPKLKVLDCIEVAISFPVSTCLVTAAWNMETSAPKDTPHKRNAICETYGVPLKISKMSMVPKAKVSINTVKAPRWSSTTLPATTTDMIVPMPNRMEANLIPPT